MQIWQLFIILKQPVHISVTVFSNLTKLTNYIYVRLKKKIADQPPSFYLVIRLWSEDLKHLFPMPGPPGLQGWHKS